jgi:hypothetical protein
MTTEYRIYDGNYTHKLVRLSDSLYEFIVDKKFPPAVALSYKGKRDGLDRIILSTFALKVGGTLIERRIESLSLDSGKVYVGLSWSI